MKAFALVAALALPPLALAALPQNAAAAPQAPLGPERAGPGPGVPAGYLPVGLSKLSEQWSRWQPVENDPSCEVWNSFPRSSETAVWDGPCLDGKAHGEGVLTWRYYAADGWHEARYEGSMEGGRKHGFGVFTWSDGSRYEGEWSDGKADGLGTFVDKVGERYEGSWSNGCFNQGNRWATVDATPAECGY